ncbi:MAG TPA: serine/threonine-protein kinase [Verrucomicrobiota bacterium]|nr:serine/threonine-protein kinase [Verrucomicrobiota bacterium]
MQTAIKFAEAAPDASTPEDIAFAADQSSTIEATELSSYAKVQRLGDYELLDQIGIGGMGVVYKARQLSLNRVVALKMLLAGEYASPAVRQRFRAEAEAAAGLRHPNIVAIYETGELEGGLYFSMDLVAGRTLADMVRGTPVPPRQAAVYLKKIATAVHYAHQKGILHRDLKPSNVLIDEADEPRITDFGLAKRFDSASLQPNGASATVSPPSSPQLTELTSSGQVLGSPNFMPPEQASPKWGATGPWSDVYGLGAIFYCLLTGRPPFHASSVTETIDQVLNSEPAALRVLNPSVPVDLETICLKCLAKEPARRYDSAQELAAELERYLKGEPIRARPIGPLGRAWRWCRRKPALASLGAGLAFLLLVIIVGSPITVARIERERQRATMEARNNARNLYVSDMSLGFRVLEENHLGQVRDLLARHAPKQGEPDLRGWEWRYLWQASRGDEMMTIDGHTNGVPALAFSPDGKVLASAGWDGQLRIFDLRTVTLITNLTGHGTVAFRPRHRELIKANWAGGFEIWDTSAWRRTGVITNNDFVFSLALSSDGEMVVHSGKHTLQVWDLDAGREIFRLMGTEEFGGTQRDGRLAFSPDGRLLAYTRGNRVVLQVVGGPEQAKEIKTDRCACLAFSPMGDLLALGDLNGVVTIWKSAALERVASLTNHTKPVLCLAFSPDGGLLATSGEDRRILLWNTDTWQPVRSLRGHGHNIWTVKFSPDGKVLATGDSHGSVKLWDVDATRDSNLFLPYPSDLFEYMVRRAYPCPNGSTFMLTRSNMTFEVFDKSSLQQTARGKIPLEDFAGGTISPKGDVMALAGKGGTVDLWQVRDSKQIRKLSAGDAGWSCVLRFSPDGSRLARAENASRVKVWDLKRGREPVLLKSDQGGGTIQTLNFSADSRQLVAPHWWGGISLWDVDAEKLLGVLQGHRVGVKDAKFSPDRRLIASAGADGTARLWSVKSLAEVAVFETVAQRVLAVAFSTDGRLLAVGDAGGYVSFWRIDTRGNVGAVHTSGGAVEWLEFLPDGNTLLVATEKGVFSWRAPSFEEIARAEQQSQ